jgi:hypothetical protein
VGERQGSNQLIVGSRTSRGSQKYVFALHESIRIVAVGRGFGHTHRKMRFALHENTRILAVGRHTCRKETGVWQSSQQEY